MNKWLAMLAGVVLVTASGCKEGRQNEGQVDSGGEHPGWMTDFEAAKALAKEEGKHILIDFSGSDWCGWCIKLDKEVFSQDTFKAYADENLVLVLVDFPSDKSGQSASLRKQNEKLSEAFGVRGFPTVFILSAEGETLAKTGYKAGGPAAYVEHINKLIADS